MVAITCRGSAIDEPRIEDLISQRARDLIAAHPYFQRRSDKFEFDFSDDILIVRGRVPSFYLKQLLQSALMRLDEVGRIDNRVEVVSCDGLSSP
jgi:hypothetical protein